MEKTKATFGVDSFAKHSPKWLVPTVSGIILTIGVTSFLITGDPSLSNEFKVRINHYLTGLTMLISGLAPLFGVDIKTKTKDGE